MQLVVEGNTYFTKDKHRNNKQYYLLYAQPKNGFE